jgi:hypothetical protein
VAYSELPPEIGQIKAEDQQAGKPEGGSQGKPPGPCILHHPTAGPPQSSLGPSTLHLRWPQLSQGDRVPQGGDPECTHSTLCLQFPSAAAIPSRGLPSRKEAFLKSGELCSPQTEDQRRWQRKIFRNLESGDPEGLHGRADPKQVPRTTG